MSAVAPNDSPRAAPPAAYLAEFASGDALRRAVDRLWALGYRRLEAYSPYPVPGVAERLREGDGHMAGVVLGGGITGAVGAYAVQWWANVRSYPLDIGGRPLHPVPAFVPSAFEGMVLCGALAAFVGLLWGLRLPRLWHPELTVPGFERASVDRFWVRVDGRDRRAADAAFTARELHALGPLRVVRIEDAA